MRILPLHTKNEKVLTINYFQRCAVSGFGKSGQRDVLASRVGTGACGILERVNYREGLTAMQSHALGLYYSYTLPAENLTWDVLQTTESLQRQ